MGEAIERLLNGDLISILVFTISFFTLTLSVIVLYVHYSYARPKTESNSRIYSAFRSFVSKRSGTGELNSNRSFGILSDSERDPSHFGRKWSIASLLSGKSQRLNQNQVAPEFNRSISTTSTGFSSNYTSIKTMSSRRVTSLHGEWGFASIQRKRDISYCGKDFLISEEGIFIQNDRYYPIAGEGSTKSDTRLPPINETSSSYSFGGGDEKSESYRSIIFSDHPAAVPAIITSNLKLHCDISLPPSPRQGFATTTIIENPEIELPDESYYHLSDRDPTPVSISLDD